MSNSLNLLLLRKGSIYLHERKRSQVVVTSCDQSTVLRTNNTVIVRNCLDMYY